MLELSKKDEDAIAGIINEYHRSKQAYELEAKIQDERIQSSRDAFHRIAVSMGIDPNLTTVSLDIDIRGEQSVRYTIEGKENVQTYLETNDISQIDTVSAQMKKRIRDVQLEQQDIKVSLSEETYQTPNFTDFAQKPKSFRYKVRMSSVRGSYRIDLTQVKSTPSKGSTASLAENGVLVASPKYEIEIEALDEKAKKDDLLTLLALSCTRGTLIDPFVGTNTKLSAAMMLLQPFTSDAHSYAQRAIISRDPQVSFPGFKPVNMGLDNLLEPDVGVISIHDPELEYTVTTKIDGITAKGIVGEDDVLYIVEGDEKTNVRHSGFTLPKAAGTIFDGELVLHDLVKNPVQWFFIFDCYASSGSRIIDNHLMSYTEPSSDGTGRLDEAKAFVEQLVPVSGKPQTKDVQVKRFSKDIYTQAQTFWNEQRRNVLDYPTDGLVYTPNTKIPEWIVESGKRHWEKALKWKSIPDMTIDFLAEVQAYSIQYTDTNGSSQIGNQVALYCAINPDQPESVETISPFSVLSHSHKVHMKDDKQTYHFTTTYTPIDDQGYCCIPQTKEQFRSGTIVECQYFEQRWHPIRVRHEKTTTYHRKREQGEGERSIHDTANNYRVALSNFRDIMYPVHPEYLANKDYRANPEVVKEKNTSYYSRTHERDKYYLKPMNDFHNNAIKYRLLNDAPHLDYTITQIKKDHLWNVSRRTGNTYRLLDLACGQGGDLNRYQKRTYRDVVAIDANADNLITPKTGAYSRLNNLQHTNMNNIPIVLFLQADIAQPIGTATYEEDKRPQDISREEEELFDLGQIATGQRTPHIKHLRRYSNMLTHRQFETISIMFALHYLFEAEWMLDNFIETLNTYLAKGGIFVGTCLDNQAVHRLFGSSNQVQRRTPDGETAWMLRKRYNSEPTGCGQPIDVFIQTIGQIHTEYLVDFELLKRKLEQRNIKLRLDLGFKAFYDSKSQKNMDETMKEYSFLNRAFIFRKE